MHARFYGALVGVVFGAMLCWSGMSSPDIIRQALLFESSYLYLMFASAVATAVIGTQILRRRHSRALLTGQPIAWIAERPRRPHIVGSLVFGVGWGVADACPGPIATQLGQGIAWAVFTAAGVVFGVWLYLRRGARETEPAADTLPRDAHAVPSVG
jgi:uncharacterized membrane protein YedE/YeeE